MLMMTIPTLDKNQRLSPQFTHNHGARNNSVQGNCSSIPWQQGPELDTIAVHMNASGYNRSVGVRGWRATDECHTYSYDHHPSLYVGKYLNEYGYSDVGGTAHIPPGWDQWFGLVGNSV